MPACQSPGSSTASRCTPEIARGKHTFEIVGYSLHKGLGAGNFIRSAAFAVGGYDWCLRYYPDGSTKEDGYVAVLLELLSDKSEVRALYSFALVRETTESQWSWNTEAPVFFSTMDTSKKKNALGKTRFKKRAELEESVYLCNDRIVVECEITVIKPPLVTETTTASTVQVPPSDILGNFKKLLETEKGVDVGFSVKGEIFPAHKLVLAARSSVFMAQFYGHVGDNNRNYITIEDMQPDVFKALLHFVYTDTLPTTDDLLDCSDNKELVVHLMVAADRYAIERLKKICEHILCKSLDAATVANTLCLADQHNCRMLKDACIEYMNSLDRLDEVVASQGYQHIKRACPAVIVDMWEKAKSTKFRKI
ncbi:hypothetical protein ACP70R_003129 [Stipagrostis hirtigluma subsp. patula]